MIATDTVYFIDGTEFTVTQGPDYEGQLHVDEDVPDVVARAIIITHANFDEATCQALNHDGSNRTVGWFLQDTDDGRSLGEGFRPFSVVVQHTGEAHVICEDCHAALAPAPANTPLIGLMEACRIARAHVAAAGWAYTDWYKTSAEPVIGQEHYRALDSKHPDFCDGWVIRVRYIAGPTPPNSVLHTGRSYEAIIAVMGDGEPREWAN